MISLVGFKKGLDLQVAVVRAAAKAVMAEKKVKLSYMVGTMIEVPRGALTVDEIAQTAEFFSFGTNDLTQTSRRCRRGADNRRRDAPLIGPMDRLSPFAFAAWVGFDSLLDDTGNAHMQAKAPRQFGGNPQRLVPLDKARFAPDSKSGAVAATFKNGRNRSGTGYLDWLLGSHDR